MDDKERQKATLLAMAFGVEQRLMEQGLDSASRMKLEDTLRDIRKQLAEIESA